MMLTVHQRGHQGVCPSIRRPQAELSGGDRLTIESMQDDGEIT